MSNALFDRLKPTHRAAINMMFAKQDAERATKPRVAHMSPEHLADIKGRCERRFEVIDSLPKATRLIVHEYGWKAVKTLLEVGVTEPAKIKHVLHLLIDQGGR